LRPDLDRIRAHCGAAEGYPHGGSLRVMPLATTPVVVAY
jgi:hypothetical protein